jgi:autotransporter-associated beta strand protein
MSNLWSINGNWLEGVAPSSAEQNVVLVFPAGAANTMNVNDIPNLTVQSLTISGSLTQSYTLGGNNPITLTGPITDSSTVAGGVLPFNNIMFGITLAATQTITVSSAAGPGLQISGVISGSGGVTKAGAGLLDLSGANTYTGTTTVSQGTLQGNIPGPLIIGDNVSAPNSAIVTSPTLNPNAPVTVNASGQLNVGLGSLTIGPLNMVGGNVTIAGFPPSAIGMLTLNGDVTATADAAGNPATISGAGNLSLGSATRTFTVTGSPTAPGMAISVVTGDGFGVASNLVKAGPGTLALSAANTYTGGTTLTNGTLTVGNNGALGTGVLALNGGTLQSTTFIALANAFTVGGPASIGGMNEVELDGAGNLTAGNTLTITNTSFTVFLGVLSGAGGLTVAAGAAAVELNRASTYTGATAINSGLLLVGGVNFLPSTTAVTIAANGILGLNGFNDRIGSLAGNGGVRFQEPGDQPPPPPNTLFTNGDNSSTTFSGVISGMGNLVKEGTGTLTLSGSDTFTGTTTISAGTLLVNGSLTVSSSVTVNGGATLGGAGFAGSITAAGTVSPGGPGTGILSSGNAVFNAGSTFVVKLNSTTVGSGYDQLNAIGGAVNLTGSPTLSATAGFAAAAGNSFTIITSAGGVTGTFAGLANNALLSISGQVFAINYTANQVVLVRTSIATMTAVASSVNPSVFGQPVSFTATVTPSNPNFGTPTGTVQFQIDGANFGSPVVLSNGVASSGQINSLPAGGHTITAVYSGDTNFSTSTGMLTQNVNRASTSAMVSVSPNPSVFGQLVTFIASVSIPSPGAGTPTGVVQFQIDGNNFGNPVSVTTSGGQTTASFSTAALAAGAHSISASYSGDANFAPTPSAPVTLTVNPANTFTGIMSSSNPSVFGLPVSFTAVVQAVPPGSGVPTGTVTFQDGMTPLGTASLDSTGTAVFTTTALIKGNHSITAVYSGSMNFNPITSAPLIQTITTSPFEAFVTALYRDVLERAPDTVGFNFWVQQLQAGATRAAVAFAFETSPEYAGLVVDTFYLTFFGRPADAAGQTFWVNALVSGLSAADVAVGFLTSPEYTAAHPTNASYVNGLYVDVLGRQQADPAGLAFWQGVLQQGIENRTQVAFSFLSSTEALTQAIDFYYTNLLGRPPDPAGLQGFLAALQTGRFTPPEITTVFLASDEFFARAIMLAGG